MMFKKIFILFSCGFLLSGCFAETMTLVQSGIGASQGRALQSAASPALSLSIKQSTGKFPIEHIIIREKNRLAKKTSNLERKIIDNAMTKMSISKKKIQPLKKGVENQATKIVNNIRKAKTFALYNFSHKPRFSYSAK